MTDEAEANKNKKNKNELPNVKAFVVDMDNVLVRKHELKFSITYNYVFLA